MFAGEKRPRQPLAHSSEEGVDAKWDRHLQGKLKALQDAMVDHDDAEGPLKRKALEAVAAVKHHLKHRTTTLGKAPMTLGKEVDYPSGGTPTPGVLDAIPRAQSAARKRFGAPRGEGVDVWNAYEVLYLQGPKRRVRAAALEMRVPSTSPCLVESKSFKLYLFSLRRCQFAGDAELLATIAADLAPVLGAVPQLALDQPRPPRAADYFDRVLPIFAPGPAETTAEEALAAAAAGSGAGAPVEAVNVLVPGYMSLCPVTGQPDFADVEIYYNGPALDWSGVAEYFARKFEHQVRERSRRVGGILGFHGKNSHTDPAASTRRSMRSVSRRSSASRWRRCRASRPCGCGSATQGAGESTSTPSGPSAASSTPQTFGTRGSDH